MTKFRKKSKTQNEINIIKKLIMEVKKIILNLSETASEMEKILSHEVEGFAFAAPKLVEVFGAEVKSMVPAVLVEASRKQDTKYLIYSPLTRQMLCLDEGTFLDPEVGAIYQNGALSAQVVEENGKKTIELEYNDILTPCFVQEKAKQHLGALLAISYSTSLRAAYYALPPEKRELKPAMIIGGAYWYIKLGTKNGRAETIVVSATEGCVFSLGIQENQIREITESGYCHTISVDIYWDGKRFTQSKK